MELASLWPTRVDASLRVRGSTDEGRKGILRGGWRSGGATGPSGPSAWNRSGSFWQSERAMALRGPPAIPGPQNGLDDPLAVWSCWRSSANHAKGLERAQLNNLQKSFHTLLDAVNLSSNDAGKYGALTDGSKRPSENPKRREVAVKALSGRKRLGHLFSELERKAAAFGLLVAGSEDLADKAAREPVLPWTIHRPPHRSWLGHRSTALATTPRTHRCTRYPNSRLHHSM